MPAFRLEPRDTASPHWKRSWHDDVCLVMASSEAEARQRASAIFDQVAPHQSDTEPLVNPWTEADLVVAVEVHDHPDHMSDGMIALPDGLGGWQIRGGGADGTGL
jgi:hypothetical protein